jgi:hypothetical protein
LEVLSQYRVDWWLVDWWLVDWWLVDWWLCGGRLFIPLRFVERYDSLYLASVDFWSVCCDFPFGARF